MPTMVLYQMLATASQEGSVQDVVCALEAILDVLETKGTLTTTERGQEKIRSVSFTSRTEQRKQQRAPPVDVLNGETLITILGNEEGTTTNLKSTNQYGELMKCVSLLFFVPAVDNILEHRQLIQMFRPFIGDSSPVRCAITRGCSYAVEIYLSLFVVSKIILLSDNGSRKKSILRSADSKEMTIGDWLERVKFFKSNPSTNNKKGKKDGSSSRNSTVHQAEENNTKLDIYRGWIFDAANDEIVKKILSSNKYTLLDLATIVCNSPFGRLLLTRQNTFLRSDYNSTNLTTTKSLSSASDDSSSSNSILPDMIGYDTCFSPTTTTATSTTNSVSMMPSKKPVVTDVDGKRSSNRNTIHVRNSSSCTNGTSVEKKDDCHSTDVALEPTVCRSTSSKKSTAINKNRKRSKDEKICRVVSSPSISPTKVTEKSTGSSSSYDDYDDPTAEGNVRPSSPSPLQKSAKIANIRKKSKGKTGAGKAAGKVAISTPSVSSTEITINSTDCSSFEDDGDDEDDGGDKLIVGITKLSSPAAAATTTNGGSSDSIGTADPDAADSSTTSSVLVEVEDDDDDELDDDFHIVAHEEYFVEKSSLPRTTMEKDPSWEIIA